MFSGIAGRYHEFRWNGGCITGPDTGRPPILSVLYVDDEPVLLDICKLYLEQCPDISVSIVSSVENALKILDTSSFDVIISDYQMPGTDGIGFLKILKEKNCSIPFILFTSRGRDEVMSEALRNGAIFYIQKGGAGDPWSRFAELDFKIREACRRNEAGDMLHETRHSVIRYALGGEMERGQCFPRSISFVSVLPEQGRILPVDPPAADIPTPRLRDIREEFP